MHKNPRANAIYLHRRLALPFFPDTESGPAAIISASNEILLSTVIRSRCIALGESDSACGARAGVRKRVVVTSPLIVGAADLASRLSWRMWNHDQQRAPKAVDVIVVVRPLEILRGMTLREAAEHLLRQTFGEGAIYDCSEIRRHLLTHQQRRPAMDCKAYRNVAA